MSGAEKSRAKIDWQVFWTIVSILVAVAIAAQQGGFVNFGEAVNDRVPQIVNLSGMQIERQRVSRADQHGRLRDHALVVTRAPTMGKWRGLFCEGDQIDFINGYEVDLATARRTLYVNRGRSVRVLPSTLGAEWITIEPDSFARSCS